MDRSSHLKYIPECPRNPGIVDQYMWPQKDTTKYMCYNGISSPIYDCKGDISFSLPLEEYPPVHAVHPEIELIKRPHMRYRGQKGLNNPIWNEGRETSVVENFQGRYHNNVYNAPHFYVYSNRVPGYPLPQQTGQRNICGL